MNINRYDSTNYGSGDEVFKSNSKYAKLIDLRIERDKLVNERNHIKSRIELCEGQEKIWKDQRRKFSKELKNVNQDIIKYNEDIKLEMQRINGSGNKY